MLYNVSITFIYFLSHLIITTVLQVRCHYPLIKEHWIWATVFKQKKKMRQGLKAGLHDYLAHSISPILYNASQSASTGASSGLQMRII